jgi:hypothetical protein
MNAVPTDFNTGVVAPFDCLKEGWEMIKDQYWLFFGITLVAMLIGGAVPLILIGPMTCGLYLCLFAKMSGEPVQFENLFKGFDYFVQGLIAALIQAIPAFVIVVPAYAVFAIFSIFMLPHDRYSRSEGPPVAFFIILVLFVIVVVVVSVLIHSLFIFSYPLIVDRKLPGFEAVKLSVRAAFKNFGGVLGLTLLLVGLGILGVICCYVGVLFVLPVSFAAYAAAYRRVFPDIPQSFMAPPPPPASWAA